MLGADSAVIKQIADMKPRFYYAKAIKQLLKRKRICKESVRGVTSTPTGFNFKMPIILNGKAKNNGHRDSR